MEGASQEPGTEPGTGPGEVVPDDGMGPYRNPYTFPTPLHLFSEERDPVTGAKAYVLECDGCGHRTVDPDTWPMVEFDWHFGRCRVFQQRARGSGWLRPGCWAARTPAPARPAQSPRGCQPQTFRHPQ